MVSAETGEPVKPRPLEFRPKGSLTDRPATRMLWWRVLWSVLPAGLLVAVFVPQLQHHNWRMAGLHAITLGPILVTLGWFVFRLRPPWVLLAGYLVAVVGMNTALVLDVAPAPVWVALFSTATALGVGAVLVHHQARQHFAIPEE